MSRQYVRSGLYVSRNKARKPRPLVVDRLRELMRMEDYERQRLFRLPHVRIQHINIDALVGKD